MYYNDRLEQIKKDALHISSGKFEIFAEVYADLLIEEICKKIETMQSRSLLSARDNVYEHFGLINPEDKTKETHKLFFVSLV